MTLKGHRVTLITGGSRSGKSRFALEKALPYPRKIFLATALAIDSEMEERIKKHQTERGPHYLTVEEPLHLGRAIRSYAPAADAILVDCLTFWLNNLFHFWNDQPDRIAQEIQEFLFVVGQRPTSLILVTNEIGLGVIPADSRTRRFVEKQGWLSQEVARRADEVIWMVAGIPQILKQEEAIFPTPSPLGELKS